MPILKTKLLSPMPDYFGSLSYIPLESLPLHSKLKFYSIRSSLAGNSTQISNENSFRNSTHRAVCFKPCIDIHQGKVKQIVGSTLKDLKEDNSKELRDSDSSHQSLVTNFVSKKSSAEFAELYRRDNLVGGHVIMLGSDSASQSSALEAVAAFPGGLQVGGGINLENAKMFLDAGASHVIVTSFVFRDGQVDLESLKSLVNLIGKKRLVLDLSCRKKNGSYVVVTNRWQKFSDLIVNEKSLNELAQSADEFLVHGVDVEGLKLGIDEELVSLLGKYSPIPVTYAGGVKNFDDLEKVKTAGNNYVDVTIGSALDIFGGDMPYEKVVEWHNTQKS